MPQMPQILKLVQVRATGAEGVHYLQLDVFGQATTGCYRGACGKWNPSAIAATVAKGYRED